MDETALTRPYPFVACIPVILILSVPLRPITVPPAQFGSRICSPRRCGMVQYESRLRSSVSSCLSFSLGAKSSPCPSDKNTVLRVPYYNFGIIYPQPYYWPLRSPKLSKACRMVRAVEAWLLAHLLGCHALRSVHEASRAEQEETGRICTQFVVC